jgi:hypothetical protein
MQSPAHTRQPYLHARVEGFYRSGKLVRIISSGVGYVVSIVARLTPTLQDIMHAETHESKS